MLEIGTAGFDLSDLAWEVIKKRQKKYDAKMDAAGGCSLNADSPEMFALHEKIVMEIVEEENNLIFSDGKNK